MTSSNVDYKIIKFDVVELMIDVRTGYFSERYTLNGLNKFKAKVLNDFYASHQDIILRLGVPKESISQTSLENIKLSAGSRAANASYGAYYKVGYDKFLCKELYLAFVSWLRPDLYLRYSAVVNNLIETGRMPK